MAIGPSVLFITTEYYPMYNGGLGMLTKHVVEELIDQGAKVTVLVPQVPKSTKLPINTVNLHKNIKSFLSNPKDIPGLDFGIDTFISTKSKHRKPWPRLYSNVKSQPKLPVLYPNNMPAVAKALAWAVDKYLSENPNFDLVIAPDWFSIPTFVLLKETKPRLPFIFYINATELDRAVDLSRIGATGKVIFDLEKRFYKEADGVIAISDLSRTSLEQDFEVSQSKLTAVYNDVNFVPVKESYKAIKNGKNVMFLGRVERQKGLSFLVQTAMRVNQIDPSIKFIIAGDGDQLPNVVDSVVEQEMEKQFIFTGWLDSKQKAKLYRSVALFVMPSPREPFGLTPFEAIRSGVPVISSNTSGFTSVIKSTPTFNYHDVDGFAQLIIHYINNTEDAKELLKLQSKELKEHSWSDQVKHLLEFCGTTINNKS